jgi:hypothetical protein
MTIVVNLFAGPGSGKSTLAHGLMHELKSNGVSAEFAHEWIKHPVWQGRTDFPQYYVWAKQQKLIDGLVGKVDIIVTDSPTLLTIVYGDNEPYALRQLAFAKWQQGPKSLNVYVDRVKDYWAAGRTQTEEEAKTLDGLIHNGLLHAYGLEHAHTEAPGFSIRTLARQASNML